MPSRSSPTSVDEPRQKVKSKKLKAPPAFDSPPETIEVNGIPRWEQPLRDLQENGCMSPMSAPRRSHTSCKSAPKRVRPKGSSKIENRGRRRNLENTILTINIDRQKSIGDLTINMPDFASPRKTTGTLGSSSLQSPSSDLSGDEKMAKPLWNSSQRKLRKKKASSKKKSGKTRRHSYQVESKSTIPMDDQVSLSELYCSWKEGSLSSSQDNSSHHCHSSTSDLSSVTSLLDEAYVFGGKKSPPTEADKLIEMQEEEMVKLAMERSVADLSVHSGSATTNSGSTFSSYDSSCSAKACRKMPRPPSRRPKPYERSKLAEAGCHLSMIGSVSSRRRSSTQDSLMLNSFGNLSDEEDENMLPAPAPDPSFVWKRDTETNKWYKKPTIPTNSRKSEEDLMLEKASELSMKDCLATSLHELQSVTTFHQYRYPSSPGDQ